MRKRFAVGLGLVALALAGASVATATISPSAHRRAPTGTLAGRVQLAGVETGIARVFNARGRLVAQRDVHGRGHFRFVLKPGHYELRLDFSPVNACPQRWPVRVQADRTSRVMAAEACASY